MEHILVIAYGNPLRSDDGIAWQAAKELRRELPATARVMCVHQLTPELAEDMSRFGSVIFLDASKNGKPGTVRCEPVFAHSRELRFSHHVAPEDLLALCDRLYSSRPGAFLISVHGKCFDHGQELSPPAVHAVPLVVEHVSRLMTHMSRESAQEPLNAN